MFTFSADWPAGAADQAMARPGSGWCRMAPRHGTFCPGWRGRTAARWG